MHIENKRNISYYAKLLIVIGVTLLFYGIVLDYNNKIKLVDPTGVVSKVISDGNIINITRDGAKINVESSRIDSGEELDSNNEEYYSKLNDTIVKSIKNEYGITVKYGSEIAKYSVIGVDIVPEYDSIIINDSLNKLIKTLKYYPSGFFNEIKKGGIPLSIYLIDGYSDPSITGVTDSNYSYAIISIAISYPFEDSFFHESYHYIERYMQKRGVNYLSWNSLNPSGFKYGRIDKKYSYAFTHSENSYFVNTYAEYSEEEDRASTFEYMMASNKSSCMNNGTPIWNKAKRIKDTIESVFKTVKPSNVEYWERYIKDDVYGNNYN